MNEPNPQRCVDLIEFVTGLVPSLDEMAATVVATTMGYMEWMIGNGKQAMPHAGFVKDGKLGVLGTEFHDENDDADKESFAGALRNLRKDCDAVVFGTEVWMAHVKKEVYESHQHLQPRYDPNRTECAMVQLWLLSGRHFIFVSKINRNPTKMEDWSLYYDSETAEHKVKGRFT